MSFTQVEDKGVILRLFEDIETALEELIADKVINSVEIFNSQMDFEDEERPRLYPFIAVQITVEWDPPQLRSSHNENNIINQNEQKGDCTVTVHHVFSQLQQETLSFKLTEPVRHKVHRALNLLKDGNYYTSLIRTSTLDNSSHDRVFDLITSYKCMILEPAYTDETQETVTDPTISLDTDLDIDNQTIRTGDGEN